MSRSSGVRREQDPTTPHPESRVEETCLRHKWTGENLRVVWRENLRTGYLPALVWDVPGSPIHDLPRPSGDSSGAGEREQCQSRWRPTQTPRNSRDRNPGCLGQRRPCSQKPRTNPLPSRSSLRVNTAIDAIYPASKGPPPRGALGLGTQPFSRTSCQKEARARHYRSAAFPLVSKIFRGVEMMRMLRPP